LLFLSYFLIRDNFNQNFWNLRDRFNYREEHLVYLQIFMYILLQKLYWKECDFDTFESCATHIWVLLGNRIERQIADQLALMRRTTRIFFKSFPPYISSETKLFFCWKNEICEARDFGSRRKRNLIKK